MDPFLFGDLTHQIKTQVERIVLPKVLQKTPFHKIDLVEKNLIPAKSVSLGIATKSSIRKANEKCHVDDTKILNFREDVKKALLKFVKNLLDKSPIHYKLTKAISCFDPKVAGQQNVSKVRMESLLTILLENKWATNVNVDIILREYVALCSSPLMIEEFKNYSRNERLDHFWVRHTANNEFLNLRKIWSLVSTLSHGNANVERGFSVNSECIVDNMREELLVARRCIYDAVISIGGLKNLVIEKPLIHSARNAYSRYKEHMKTKEKKEESESAKKRKLNEQLNELEIKKARILQEADKEAALVSQEILSLKSLKSD